MPIEIQFAFCCEGIALGQRFNILLIEPNFLIGRVQFLRDGGKLIEIERRNHYLARVVFQKAPVGERDRRAGCGADAKNGKAGTAVFER